MAAVLCLCLGAANALVVTSSELYVAKLRMQRTIDLAVLAAASTPGAVSGSAVSASAQATASNIATINGLGAAGLTLSASTGTGTDPSGVLTGTLSTPVSLPLAGLLQAAKALPVAVSAKARTSAAPCFVATKFNVWIDGSATINGPACKVETQIAFQFCSLGSVNVSKITVGWSEFLESLLVCPFGSLKPDLASFKFNTPAVDPLIGDTRIGAMDAHLNQLAAGWPFPTSLPLSMPAPLITNLGTSAAYFGTGTVASGAHFLDLTIGNASVSFAGGGADPGCANPTTIAGTLWLSGTNRLTFAPGCYVFQGMTSLLAGGSTSVITSGGGVTLVFNGTISNLGGASLSVGDASVSINGISNSGGGSISFGRGTLLSRGLVSNLSGSVRFGGGGTYISGPINNLSGAVTIGDGPTYIYGTTIGNTGAGSITFGNGPFYAYFAGISASGGTLSFGNGPFSFGLSNITTSVPASVSFGTGAIDLYNSVVTGGGSSFTIGAGGSASAGSALVSGYMSPISLLPTTLNAVGVTWALKGGYLFFNGQGSMNLTAPTSANPTYGYQNILAYELGGILSVTETGSGTDTYSGILYAPDEPLSVGSVSIDIANVISISGFQHTAIPSGGCFSAIGYNMYFELGATISAAPCDGGNLSLQASLIQ